MVLLDKSASLAAVAAVLSFSSSSALAGPVPPREGAVSRLEYNTAKEENIISGRYVRRGHVWQRYFWHCPV
jgi:hypothetical protein